MSGKDQRSSFLKDSTQKIHSTRGQMAAEETHTVGSHSAEAREYALERPLLTST